MASQIQVPSHFNLKSRFRKNKRGEGWIRFNGAKRNRMDIIADILLFCFQTRTKTSIMYDTNLNYAQLQDLLKFLPAQKMLSLTMGKYATSEKGDHFLDLYFGLLETLIGDE